MPEEPDRHLIPKHTIRMEQDLWDELGEATGRKEISRSELFRQVAAALLSRPGAKMPRRRDYTKD